MAKAAPQNAESNKHLEIFILIFLAFAVPLFVMPRGMLNAFHTPKTALITVGVSIIFVLHITRFFLGKESLKNRPSLLIWVVILISLNIYSLFYTKNPYFTKVAILMNVSGLLIFYFGSLHINGKNSNWLMWAIGLSGLLVSIITYLQFTGHYVLFKGIPKGINVMGTIGNSNFLGAYLLFPIFSSAGLILLTKGKLRLMWVCIGVAVLGALLFSRARASWLGLGVSFPIYLIVLKKIYDFSLREYVKANLKRVVVYGIIIFSVGLILWYIAPSKFHKEMQLKNWAQTETLAYRWKYYRASWWLFKQSPLFGEGLWSYRNQVYRAQAEIYKKDDLFFKDYKMPQPRRVHNEYLEILNDGGIVSAAALLIFFVFVMRHGWTVVRDRDVKQKERVLAATAFCAVVAIMVSALFFFPFRINSTLVMTVLMMGIIEGLYIRNKGKYKREAGPKIPFAFPAIIVISISILGIIWFGSYKKIRGERAFYQHNKAMSQRKAQLAERYILEAVSYDPGNSLFTFSAGRMYMDVFKDFVKAEHFFETADVNFNGDLIKWVIHYVRGLLRFRVGSLFEAREEFEKALYYYPYYDPARKKLQEVEKIIKENDRLTIKLR
jgi:O-antigen ligase